MVNHQSDVNDEGSKMIRYSHLSTSFIGTFPLVFVLNRIGMFGLVYVSSHPQDLYESSQ